MQSIPQFITKHALIIALIILGFAGGYAARDITSDYVQRRSARNVDTATAGSAVEGYLFREVIDEISQTDRDAEKGSTPEGRTYNLTKTYLATPKGNYLISDTSQLPKSIKPNTRVSLSGTVDEKTKTATGIRVKGSGTGSEKTLSGTYNLGLVLLRTNDAVADMPDAETLRTELGNQISNLYNNASYNKLNVSLSAVYGWHTMPVATAGFCDSTGSSNIFYQEQVAQAVGLANLGNHDGFIVLTDCAPEHTLSANSTLGKQTFFFNGDPYTFSLSNVFTSQAYMYGNAQALFNSILPPYVETLLHEVGHGLGMDHARSYNCYSKVLRSDYPCFMTEYGNPFDVMGAGNYSYQPHAQSKIDLGWIEDSEVIHITASGSYRLDSFNDPSSPKKAAIIHDSLGNKVFMVEYRYPTGPTDPDAPLGRTSTLKNLRGVFVYRYAPGLVDEVQLLDAQPTSPDFQVQSSDKRLSTLARSGTNPVEGYSGEGFTEAPATDKFTDPVTGITVGPVTKAGGASRSATFTVTYPAVAAACTESAPLATSIQTGGVIRDQYPTYTRISIIVGIKNVSPITCPPASIGVSTASIPGMAQYGAVLEPVTPQTIIAGATKNFIVRFNVPTTQLPGGSYTLNISPINNSGGLISNKIIPFTLP